MTTVTSTPCPASSRRRIAAHVTAIMAVGMLAQACGSAPEVGPAALAPATTAPVTASAAPTTTVASTTTPMVTDAPVETEAPIAEIAPAAVPAPTNVRKPLPPAAAPKPAPRPAPKPAPRPVVAAPKPAATSYANCSAVRAAGADPIYVGQPGYSSKLDRDGDGVACET
jgi:hypothetical protein